MNKIILSISILLFSFSVSATVITGYKFLDYVKDLEDNNDIQAGSFLNGYVAGLIDAHELELTPCISEGVKMSSLRDAVAIYLKRNPSERRWSVDDYFVIAVKEEWDCS